MGEAEEIIERLKGIKKFKETFGKMDSHFHLTHVVHFDRFLHYRHLLHFTN